ncbi:flavin mononucleotide hydrolase 1, chloroplatic-like isoform X3 [Salvia miltiorrhiza]|uniref:flavin mononucleotide hydrolase 1, chloroplatic-like isoform X3 n=1 Tax=Salvia miltiorrhiza TaxID=226208 RepID=UPI0025AB71A2|nr:flavin mononucleotide hydrolase 1, chloroplatic-like isoform X3 [Salvia miltiorrhiza]
MDVKSHPISDACEERDQLLCKGSKAAGILPYFILPLVELAQKFFKDGRPLDLEGLKSCMRRGYAYIEGVEDLLTDLKNNGYEMHTSTNYPIWYEIIEEKLKLSSYLSWTFCSCTMGKRKPDPDFYMDMLKHLKVEPTCCVFIDDRMKNVEAALHAGFNGIHFKTADSLRKDLSNLGIL